MSDLIDRQAAIDATAEYLRDMAKIDNPSLPMSIDGWKPLAGKILDKVPSAQQEETFEFGKWYDFKRGYVLETTTHSFRILKDVEVTST